MSNLKDKKKSVIFVAIPTPVIVWPRALMNPCTSPDLMKGISGCRQKRQQCNTGVYSYGVQADNDRKLTGTGGLYC